jgi:hypothetical protein
MENVIGVPKKAWQFLVLHAICLGWLNCYRTSDAEAQSLSLSLADGDDLDSRLAKGSLSLSMAFLFRLVFAVSS